MIKGFILCVIGFSLISSALNMRLLDYLLFALGISLVIEGIFSYRSNFQKQEKV